MASELRTALFEPRTSELLTLRLLLTAEDDLTALFVPCCTAEPELVLADLVTVVPRDGFTAELRVVPDFCLTSEFVLFLLLLTVADFLSALLRDVTAELFLCAAEDLTAERVPTLFSVLLRDR